MNIDQVLPQFAKSKLKNLYHICTLPNGKDIKLSQFTAWLRKNKAIRYYAVRGMANGIHFHALVEMADSRVSRFTKAKTTVIPVKTPLNLELFFPERWEVQETETNRQHVEYQLDCYVDKHKYRALHLFCLAHIAELNKIKKKERSLAVKAKRLQQHEFHVRGVLTYLEKNLQENAPPHYEYDHFQSQFP